MARVSLRQLEKRYHGPKKGQSFRAVKKIDLEVDDKEFMVLVGPSGCGKSTTLRMIAGLEEITDGIVEIGGEAINHVPPKDRDIAMVFQNYALYPHMTVYENMAFGLKLRKFAKNEIDKRVDDAARILGLEDLLERKPKALSGGQRQRVAVGRAIVRKPKVFLFDEPLSNLDAKMRVSMRSEISKLHDRLQVTMIYVTHDQVEAMTMGDRICVMNDGEIMQVDDPISLYDRPANLFVACFIVSPQLNFFSGTVSREEDRWYFLEEGDGEGGIRYRLGDRWSKKLEGREDRKIVLGIRPEDIEIDSSADGRTSVSAAVELSEPMGSETLVYLNTGKHTFVVKDRAREKLPNGERVNAIIDESKIHLFDADTEKAL